MRQRPYAYIVIPALLILCCWGCASAPDIVTADKKPNAPYSNDEIRKITVDQPYLISGDYFRKREQPPGTNLGALFDREKTITSNQEELKQQINSLEKEVASLNTARKKEAFTSSSTELLPENSQQPDSGIPIKTSHLKIKTGLLIDEGKVLPADIQKIAQTAERLAQTMPMVLVGNDEIYETLADNNAIENRDLYKTSGILTVYPGIRMLVLLETFNLPDTLPGTGSATVSIVDSGLFYRYQPVRFEMPLNTDEDRTRFVETVLTSAFTKAVKKSKIAPWFCRTFSNDGTLFYINAGEKTGLKKGTLLKITAPGKQVKSPAGLPAGWIPGETKGTLKIETYFGRDFAACSLIKGEKPTVHDYLTE